MNSEARKARLLMLKLKAQKMALNPVYSGVAALALELVEINISINEELANGERE